MEMVILTAIGVGGATVFGSVLGFLFRKISHRFSDIVLSFAAGVMLCAAVTGLILPSLEYASPAPLLISVAGIFCGALMYIAVEGYKQTKNPLILFVCVAGFILCGFEHCIADMFYVSVAQMWSTRAFLCVVVISLGNAVGGMLIPMCKKI